jgi:hypothetical protein
MKYSEDDLKNIIAICEQADPISVPGKLAERCRKALAYRDVSIRLTKHDKEYLQYVYDKDMDADAKETLERILN